MEYIAIGVAVIGTLFAYLAWRATVRGNKIGEQDFALAKELAGSGPDISVRGYIFRDRDYPATGFIGLEVINDGDRPANRIHGWIRFGPEVLSPPLVDDWEDTLERTQGVDFQSRSPLEDGKYTAEIYDQFRVPVDGKDKFVIRGEIRPANRSLSSGPVHCKIVSDEGGLYDDYVDLESVMSFDP